MSDILAGGSIDPTTSGPTPQNNDPRPQDVVSDQKVRQEQNAVGGTQQPPRVEPPIVVPSAISIAAPPLPTLEEPSFLSIGQSSADAIREVARQSVVDVLKNVTIDGRGPSIEGSSISFDTERRSVSSSDFGTGGNKDFISSGYSQLSDYPSLGGTVQQESQKQSRLDSADFGTAKGMEDNSSAESYKAAYERSEERKRSDPSFDEGSRLRQRGESQTEFKERQEKLQAERAEAQEREEQIEQLKAGDTSVLPSGMVPVAFTRADRQEKLLAYVSTEFVAVVGAKAGKRTVTLPDKTDYYEAGGGSGPPHPWQILIQNAGTAQDQNWQYKVELKSNVYRGLGDRTTIPVTGLNVWTSLSSEGYIVLVGNFNSSEVVESLEINGPEEELADGVELEGDDQDKKQVRFTVELGYIYKDENDAYQVIQNAFQNLTLTGICADGYGATYPMAI